MWGNGSASRDGGGCGVFPPPVSLDHSSARIGEATALGRGWSRVAGTATTAPTGFTLFPFLQMAAISGVGKSRHVEWHLADEGTMPSRERRRASIWTGRLLGFLLHATLRGRTSQPQKQVEEQ